MVLGIETYEKITCKRAFEGLMNKNIKRNLWFNVILWLKTREVWKSDKNIAETHQRTSLRDGLVWWSSKKIVKDQIKQNVREGDLIDLFER